MNAKRKRHRPGSKWRVLAQGPVARRLALDVTGPMVTGEGLALDPVGADFDELVVDNWFHLERMDTNTWWMRIYNTNRYSRSGRLVDAADDLIVWITVGTNGRATKITTTHEPSSTTPGLSRPPHPKRKRR
jgi:hypothetical protein